MKADILLGLQWGDEGKGKIVDVLTPHYNMVARFQGGPNAGHTLEFDQFKHVLHTIPSGIFHEKTLNVVGNGVVIDPVILLKEIQKIEDRGISVDNRLCISRKAHLILPTHKLLDAASEKAKGQNKIGSTLKGIGPTYMDKTGRNGLRVGDIAKPNFKEKYNELVNKHRQLLDFFSSEYDLAPLEQEWFEAIKLFDKLRLVDSEHLVNEYLDANKTVLAEGAQGSLLDIEFGSYPFVTSSNTLSAGACTGLGIAPARIGEVYGIFKAYCTRVGSGPFPTELLSETGELLRTKGHEFGATTGRPRRCGWLDLVALKYAIMLNGVTRLIMTKADVLSDFDTIRVCTKYKVNGTTTDRFPYDICDTEIEPVYDELPGWKTDLTGLTSPDDMPEALTQYVHYLENALNLPVSIVSVGPDRTQTLLREAIPA
ncbi:MAG: adenylosuccinate synthase [Flavobacteriales bacterium]|nr:adenylosuccinate synthase [Flavobacteriales bacterium]MCB9447683.1 adenylosuccinate synthase [Flavobacteriales bacterium]